MRYVKEYLNKKHNIFLGGLYIWRWELKDMIEENTELKKTLYGLKRHTSQ